MEMSLDSAGSLIRPAVLTRSGAGVLACRRRGTARTELQSISQEGLPQLQVIITAAMVLIQKLERWRPRLPREGCRSPWMFLTAPATWNSRDGKPSVRYGAHGHVFLPEENCIDFQRLINPVEGLPIKVGHMRLPATALLELV